MGAAQHTPGPWAYRPDTGSESFAFEVVRKGQGGICLAYQRDSGDAEANARLIAAAPEMLAELREAESYLAECECGTESSWRRDVLRGVRAAIAKAEGREP